MREDPVTQADGGSALFAGGGELGAAMAARDWSETPLGPADGWPASLRNAVRIVLTSRFSMWAAWGPELSFFYNDAYRRDTLQAKHPWALGRPAHEVWAEIWHDIGPRIRSVLDTGVATWDEDLLLFLERSGYPEETYHTFSYSPLDDGGRTAGMLCVVTETTQRVVGERRMAHLRDLAAAIATTRSHADLQAAVAEQLGRNGADLPFSGLYLFDDEGTARLACTAGIDGGAPPVPAALTSEDAGPWSLARLRAGEQVVVDDLADPGLPTGSWARPPTQAVAVPIASAPQGPAPVAGFLVVGLNPHRRYDDAYRGFLELVANQIASGLVNAGSYEAERRRAEALAELDRAKTDFFSNVSHEFRTPLTLIMGPLEELRRTSAVEADARAREELDVIHRNALRLGRLVNTLLDFSRLQAGRIEARFEPVDLAAITAELASVFRSAVGRAGLAFDVDCPPLGTPVHVDRDMWEKVVLNLLSNALKFTFEGGITVRLRRDETAAVLTVSDSGTGIPPEELPRLFERFHRVSDVRARSGEGSGIGLAMVRELVTLHGGTVGVESMPDVGTTFTITLPLGTAHLPADRLAPPAAEAQVVSTAAEPFVSEALRWLPGEDGEGAAEPEPAGVEGRVLVADDNADMREYLTRLLRPRYAVQAVTDGAAALQAALADPPDLVVSDVMMPKLDGMRLLAELRRDARTSRVPVLLLSARAGQEAAVEGLAAGADDYLVKPFSAQELLARVGAHLHLGRARREAEQRFTAMADLAPALIWVADADGRRVFVNRGWTAFTGRPVDAALGDGWREAVHAEDRARYRAAVAAATAAGRGWEVEFRLRRSDGAYHWLLERAAPIGGGEAPAGYVGSCTDINARFRETERQALLAETGAVLDRETDVHEQLSRLARVVVDSRLADLCTVRLVGEDGRLRFAGVAGADPATEAALSGLDPDGGVGRELLRGGDSVLVPDDGAGAAVASSVERLAAVGMRSGMAVPLVVRGRVVAVLGMARRPDSPAFNQDDRELAEEIAARAALAVDNAMLLTDERAAARRLGLLQQATAELSAATTPIQVAVAAASHVRQLAGPEARVGVYELDAAHRSLTALTIDGEVPPDDDPWARISLHTPLAVTAAVADRRSIWVEDPADWPGSRGGLNDAQSEVLRDFGFTSTIALPLIVAGRVVGVIGIGFPAGRRFPGTERRMLLAVAEQCAQALDRARLYRSEQRIAQTLQLSLLPQGVPQFGRVALAAQYLPGAEGTAAGGDWYDVVELGGSRVAVAVGDVVGQGPAAAAVMGQLRSALSAALLLGSGPAEALELLDGFAARLPGALASTAACVVLDWETGGVRWSRAGHPPPVVVTPDGGALLDGDGAGPVLGVPDRRPYREGSAHLEPGSTLLLYTDGLVERRGEHLDTGLDRLIAAAARLHAAGPEQLTRDLLTEVLADAAQPDDVAVLAARLLPAPLHGVLPADPTRLSAVRRQVAAWAHAAGIPEETVEDLTLALGEALANAVEHAYAGVGTGDCHWTVERDLDGSLRVHVEDRGTWRPPPADRGHRGRGLELIAALAEDVDVRRVLDPGDREGSGTVVTFRLPAGRAAVPPAVPLPRPAPVLEDGGTRVTAAAGPGGPVLAVQGELDLDSVRPVGVQVRERLAALPPGGTVTLDLHGVTYLASAGVGLLLELQAHARGRGLGLEVRCAPDSVPARVLGLTGVGALLRDS